MTVALGSAPSKPLPIIVRPIVDELLTLLWQISLAFGIFRIPETRFA